MMKRILHASETAAGVIGWLAAMAVNLAAILLPLSVVGGLLYGAWSLVFG